MNKIRKAIWGNKTVTQVIDKSTALIILVLTEKSRTDKTDT